MIVGNGGSPPSATQKQRKSVKKRKSIKIVAANSGDNLEYNFRGDNKNQIQYGGTGVAGVNKNDSRAQTLSPDKSQARGLLKLDQQQTRSETQQNILKNMYQLQSPKGIISAGGSHHNQTTGKKPSSSFLQPSSLDNPSSLQDSPTTRQLKHRREHSLSLHQQQQQSINNNRPSTTTQSSLIQQSILQQQAKASDQQQNNQYSSQYSTSQNNNSISLKNDSSHQQSTSNNSINGGVKSLIPLAVNAAKKLQQQQQQQHHQQIGLQMNGQSFQQQQMFSPMKSGLTNQSSSYQLLNSNQLQQLQILELYQQSQQQQQQAKTLQQQQLQQQQQFQHIIIQQQSNGSSPNQQDKLIKSNNQYQMAHQVGINGLLNMTKQRGLIQNHQQQIYNQRNQPQIQFTGTRSHSSQKGASSNNQSLSSHQQQQQQQQMLPTQQMTSNSIQLQNNGKIIAGQKQNQYVAPNLSFQQQQQQTALPLSIFDIQFYKNDASSQNHKLKNNNQSQHQQYHLAQGGNPGNMIRYSSSNNPNIKNQSQMMMHSYIIQRGNLHRAVNGFAQGGTGGYYYYDQPVAINGKQIGSQQFQGIMAFNGNNYAKLDAKGAANFRKGGSAGMLSVYQNLPVEQQKLLLHLDQTTHDDLIKQAILQELLDNQALPSQLLNNTQQIYHLDQSLKSQHQLLTSSQVQFQSQQSDEKPPAAKEQKKSKIPFANAYVEDCYKFVVVAGNNSGLIRKALERRDWWIEIPPVHSLYNFKWQPVSYGIKFERLSPIKPKLGEIGNLGNQYGSFQQSEASNNNQTSGNSNGGGPSGSSDSIITRQMVNHFEFHHLISEKANLFHQLKQHCENQKENIFDICPLTFYVEISDVDKTQQYNQSMQQFFQVYQLFEENKDRIRTIEQQIQEYKLKQSQIDQQQQQQQDDDSTTDQTTSNGDQNSSGKDGSNTATSTAATKEKDFLSILNNKQGIINNNNANKVTKFKTFNFEKRTSTRFTCPTSHFNGFNLWLLKPTHLNRGRGIHVFRDLDDLHKLVKEYCQGKDEEIKVTKKQSTTTAQAGASSPGKGAPQENNNIEDSQEQIEVNPLLSHPEEELQDQDQYNLQQTLKKKSSPSKKQGSSAYKIKHNTFIIQKYIEKPLLLYGRKFDIRVWVLLNQDYDLFFFKEGYLRTSSSEFKINLKNIDDQYVHLTNNAVQKFSEHYGQFEDGNQLGYKRFQQIIDEQYPVPGSNKCAVSVKEDIVPQMKELIIKSMYSVRKKIDPFRRKNCFELFGYDFILDQDFNVWLIEVNTNPCIEESSELLKVYLPRMIEDMLKLTIDQIFPKLKKNKQKKGGATPGSPIKNQKPKAQNIPQQQVQNAPLDKIEEEIQLENNQSIIPNENGDPYNSRKSDSQKKTGVSSRIHPVDGYSNTENMWEKIWNLDKTEQPPNKFPNCRSEYILSVNDKQFKVKRNPLYKKVAKEVKEQMQEIEKQEQIKQKDVN